MPKSRNAEAAPVVVMCVGASLLLALAFGFAASHEASQAPGELGAEELHTIFHALASGFGLAAVTGGICLCAGFL